ncbi:molybdopterin-dependent oxidoreductase [Bacillaceae bacterium S4-13-56]
MNSKEMNRRGFLKALGSLGAVVLVGPAFVGPVKQVINGVWIDEAHGVGSATQDYTADNVIFTTCQQCNTFCTIKTYIVSGNENGAYSSIVRKIAGNQYSPMNMVPYGQINYNTPIQDAVKGTGDVKKMGRGFRGGRTCLKGQAGIQTAYDAYRIKKPMKRVGERGSGVWKTISWEEAYKEILEGSPDLKTPGLKDIWAYVPQGKVMEDWDKVKNGSMSQEDFDQKYKDSLINTKHPDLGPKSNQIVFMAGNRRDLIERLTGQSLGTINNFDHGGVCGISSAMGNVRSFAGSQPKKRMIPDMENAEFVMIWGTNPLVSSKGPTTLGPQITNAIQRGMKMAVIDPRFSKTAEKADMWVPIKPGADAALALAMSRWIIENQRFDEVYLTNPNKAAANQDGEPTWSDATYLVNVSHPKRPLLRAKDIGIGEDEFVVLENGKPATHNKARQGDLEVDTTIQGMKVKSVFQMFKERAFEKTLKEYAEITELAQDQIVQLAKEFTSHGKKASIMSYRGPAKHGNGYYATRAINMLNHLIGNHDWKGGDTFSGRSYKQLEGQYDLNAVPNGNKAWGIPVTRHKTVYEKTSLFAKDGYPAKRPWFPFGNKLVQDVLPSAAEGYPYKISALFINRFSPIMSNPRSIMQQKFLADPKVVPLVVSSDIAMGESTKFADIVLPDLSYLESWNFENIFPILKTKFASLYQPVTRVVPDARPTDQVYIDLFKEMGLPGVGKDAFPDGSSLDRPEDYYLKRVANIAFDGKPVPDANPEELKAFENARKLALGKFFDKKVLENAVKPEEWKKIVYVLNRGGRFEGAGDEYEGAYLKYRWDAQACFYDEKAAGFKNSFTGEFFDGLPLHEEIKQFDGTEVKKNRGLQFVNWKSRNMGTHRTESNAWLREIRSDNYIWMNPIDAHKRGLSSGDEVRITSDEAEATGIVYVTQGIKPGIVGSAYNFGHFAYGSSREKIDGKVQEPPKGYGHTPFKFNRPIHEESGFAPKRGNGFSVNHLLVKDESYFEGYIVDLLGGSPGQLDLYVDIKKV